MMTIHFNNYSINSNGLLYNKDENNKRKSNARKKPTTLVQVDVHCTVLYCTKNNNNIQYYTTLLVLYGGKKVKK